VPSVLAVPGRTRGVVLWPRGGAVGARGVVVAGRAAGPGARAGLA